MPKAKHEPEVVRAKVSRAIQEMREGLRHMGWTDAELWALTWVVERRAMDFALQVRPDLGAE